jgi:hypothetical protein
MGMFLKLLPMVQLTSLPVQPVIVLLVLTVCSVITLLTVHLKAMPQVPGVQLVVVAGFEVSTTPPASPSGGDTYWDSEEGNAYIYYEDGTSNQWVPLVPSTPPKNATGGGTDEVFFENDTAVTTNYTLQTGKNALSAGPITINSGVTVTVPSGQSWVIV